jgi:hypothetical protein
MAITHAHQTAANWNTDEMPLRPGRYIVTVRTRRGARLSCTARRKRTGEIEARAFGQWSQINPLTIEAWKEYKEA